MDYVKLGSAGLQVSRICLGMMSYGSQAERAWPATSARAACSPGNSPRPSTWPNGMAGPGSPPCRTAPPARVALAWLLGRPGVTAPIVGATRLGHVPDALAAAQLTLSGEETRRLEEPYVPHAVLGHA